MSYHTVYDLSVQGIQTKDGYTQLTTVLRKMNIIDYAITDEHFIPNSRHQYFPSFEACNWFSSDSDMISISKQFPNYTFKLHGIGERNEDIWDAYYHNGKAELCLSEIIIPLPKSINWNDERM
ncbi:MAG: hypothetical protein IKH57_20920 [Clostridia bacterium]|nr:hypothetical protein [Clostridia bacterium]